MIEQQILQVLQRSVETALEAVQPGFPIKMMGVTLNPQPLDGRYVELINIPNNRQGDYWSVDRIYQGNMRVLLHWAVDETGPYEAMTLLDQIGAQFPKGRRVPVVDTMLEFYGDPNANGPLEGNSELLFPLTLPYRCYRGA